jgi:hypothetical protein
MSLGMVFILLACLAIGFIIGRVWGFDDGRRFEHTQILAWPKSKSGKVPLPPYADLL